MSGLRLEIDGFLAAAGYREAGRTPRGLAAERSGLDGAVERIAVWCMEPDQAGRYDEAGLAVEIEGSGVPADGSVTKLLVVPTIAGLSVPFKDRIGRAGVGIRVPVQLFDTPYKADGDAGLGTGGGEEARTVFAEFVSEAAALTKARVPQPFEVLSKSGSAVGGFASGDDLLAHLVADLAEPHDEPRLIIVLGNAGGGKSVLFSALFAARHQRFAADKRAQRDGVRPILLLPGHIRDRQIHTLDGLLDAVARTEAAAATSPRLMRWLAAAGRTSWMFDGLDEFFAGESDFVATLDALLGGSSRADILICTRDSLLTSSTALRHLVDRHLPSGRVRLYELSPWQRPSQRALAHVKLNGRLPAATDADPPQVVSFLALLDGAPSLAQLASLPFYCNLLLEMHATGRADPAGEFELLAAAVDGLIDREADKLAGGEHGFGWDVFSGADTFIEASEVVEALGVAQFSEAEQRERVLALFHEIGRDRLIELIEGIAHMMRMSEPYPNESRGLPVADLEELGRVYLDIGLMPNLEPRVLLALVQFAFFAPGRDQGHVRFAHEIIADYLAARCALGMLRAHPDTPDAVSQAVGQRADLANSVFLRYLVRELLADPELADGVRAHVESGRVRPQAMAGARALAEALARGAP